MKWCSGSGSWGPAPQALIARSKIAVSALADSPSPIPPRRQHPSAQIGRGRVLHSETVCRGARATRGFPSSGSPRRGLRDPVPMLPVVDPICPGRGGAADGVERVLEGRHSYPVPGLPADWAAQTTGASGCHRPERGSEALVELSPPYPRPPGHPIGPPQRSRSQSACTSSPDQLSAGRVIALECNSYSCPQTARGPQPRRHIGHQTPHQDAHEALESQPRPSNRPHPKPRSRRPAGPFAWPPTTTILSPTTAAAAAARG